VKVLIVYYSTYGNVYRMANLVAEGVKEIPGVQPVVRTVPKLIPKSVIDSREDMKAGREMQQDAPLVTMDDFREAGAIAFGTPTRFGNVFVSTGSLHGGQETTILTLMAPLLHLGMILVGVPYSTQELFTTQGGGSPYGPGHVAGDDNKRQIDEQEAAICRALGRRLAVISLKLQQT
jgi:NAD(P)H dehydrogenase (quinone)